MAILWADDFSRYGTGSSSRAAMLDGLPYANINGGGAEPDPDGSGGRCFQVSSGASTFQKSIFRLALPTVVTTQTLGVAWRGWLNNLPALLNDRATLMGFQRADGDYVVEAIVQLNGSIVISGIVGGTEDVVVADTVNPVISPASWNHFEMEHDNGTGEGTFYVNGISVVSWTGVDTVDDIELINLAGNQGLPSNSSSYFIKDFVVWDSTGSVNNSTMGTVLVKRLSPDSDIALGDWTPSTGATGWNLLNKTAPDDSTYLSAADTPMPSADMRFTLENLPPEITSVRGLVSVVRQRKLDGGDGNTQVALSPNGTDWDNGADRPVTTTFQYDFDISELNPDTGTAWTPVTVDSAEIRIDRTV